MKRNLILIAGLVLAFAAISFNARAGEALTTAVSLTCTTGTATLVKGWDDDQRDPSIKAWTISWTANASGNVTTCLIPGVYGTIVGFDIGSGTGGTQPTDLYDLTLTKAVGGQTVSVLGSWGSNIDRSQGLQYWTRNEDGAGNVMPVVVGGTLTFGVTNAGANKTGTIKIYVRK